MPLFQNQQVERHWRGRPIAETRVGRQAGSHRAHDIDVLGQPFGQRGERLFDGLGPLRGPRRLAFVLFPKAAPCRARRFDGGGRKVGRRLDAFTQAEAGRPAFFPQRLFVARQGGQSVFARLPAAFHLLAAHQGGRFTETRLRPGAFRRVFFDFPRQTFARRRQLMPPLLQVVEPLSNVPLAAGAHHAPVHQRPSRSASASGRT